MTQRMNERKQLPTRLPGRKRSRPRRQEVQKRRRDTDKGREEEEKEGAKNWRGRRSPSVGARFSLSSEEISARLNLFRILSRIVHISLQQLSFRRLEFVGVQVTEMHYRRCNCLSFDVLGALCSTIFST